MDGYTNKLHFDDLLWISINSLSSHTHQIPVLIETKTIPSHRIVKCTHQLPFSSPQIIIFGLSSYQSIFFSSCYINTSSLTRSTDSKLFPFKITYHIIQLLKLFLLMIINVAFLLCTSS